MMLSLGHTTITSTIYQMAMTTGLTTPGEASGHFSYRKVLPEQLEQLAQQAQQVLRVTMVLAVFKVISAQRALKEPQLTSLGP
jgi:hypothetical protein